MLWIRITPHKYMSTTKEQNAPLVISHFGRFVAHFGVWSHCYTSVVHYAIWIDERKSPSIYYSQNSVRKLADHISDARTFKMNVEPSHHCSENSIHELITSVCRCRSPVVCSTARDSKSFAVEVAILLVLFINATRCLFSRLDWLEDQLVVSSLPIYLSISLTANIYLQ